MDHRASQSKGDKNCKISPSVSTSFCIYFPGKEIILILKHLNVHYVSFYCWLWVQRTFGVPGRNSSHSDFRLVCFSFGNKTAEMGFGGFYVFLPIWQFLLSFPLTPAALSVSVNLPLALQKQAYTRTTFDVDGGLMHREFQLFRDGSERGLSVWTSTSFSFFLFFCCCLSALLACWDAFPVTLLLCLVFRIGE